MKLLDAELLKKNIKAIAEYDLCNQNVFGSSYFVYQEGNLTYKEHFGFTGIDSETMVSDSTLFRLASMTKPITAFATMILIDRGILSLDTKVKDYIPELSDAHIITPEGKDLGLPEKDVTILHLLSHTSGIGSLKPVSFSPDEKATVESLAKAFIRYGLDFEPFTHANYSGVGAFQVLALLIERASGMGYEDFLKKEVFAPLGMTDTCFTPTKEQEERIISMHAKLEEKNAQSDMHQGAIFEDYPYAAALGGAGLISSVTDYATFARMLLSEGVTEDGKALVSKETFRLMKTPFVPQEVMAHNIYSWGLGVRVITNPGYVELPTGTFGWSGAYGPHFWIDPENKICTVFMKNSKFDGGAGNKSAVRFEKAVFDSLIKE